MPWPGLEKMNQKPYPHRYKGDHTKRRKVVYKDAASIQEVKGGRKWDAAGVTTAKTEELATKGRKPRNL